MRQELKDIEQHMNGAIAHQYQQQIITRKASFDEDNVFGNRIILAIAAARGKSRHLAAPLIQLTR